MNQAFDGGSDAMQTNQNEIIQNDNPNIDERISGIRQIYLSTTTNTNSKSTRNSSYTHAKNALLINEKQRFQNQLTIGIQILGSPRFVSLGTTKVSFCISIT